MHLLYDMYDADTFSKREVLRRRVTDVRRALQESLDTTDPDTVIALLAVLGHLAVLCSLEMPGVVAVVTRAFTSEEHVIMPSETYHTLLRELGEARAAADTREKDEGGKPTLH